MMTSKENGEKAGEPHVVFVFQCVLCGREFEKLDLDGTLEPHDDGAGNTCFGFGEFVDQRLAQ